MLYIYFGTDVHSVHSKAQTLVANLLKRKPDASFYTLESNAITEAVLDELVQSRGLFEQNYIVELNQSLENTVSKDEILKKLEQMKESNNIFIIVEHSLTAPIKKKLEKFADKIQELTIKKGGKILPKNTFNIFTMSDALGARDKKKLWVLLQKATLHGIPVEEVHGTLMWQTRTMLIAKQVKTAKDSGLKPFVYNKAKQYSNNYSLDELRKLSQSLVSMYHNVRKDGSPMVLSMEVMILTQK